MHFEKVLRVDVSETIALSLDAHGADDVPDLSIARSHDQAEISADAPHASRSVPGAMHFDPLQPVRTRVVAHEHRQFAMSGRCLEQHLSTLDIPS